MSMIGKASMVMDWEHTPTPESEDIKVFATIFPQVCSTSCSFMINSLIFIRMTVFLPSAPALKFSLFV